MMPAGNSHTDDRVRLQVQAQSAYDDVKYAGVGDGRPSAAPGTVADGRAAEGGSVRAWLAGSG